MNRVRTELDLASVAGAIVGRSRHFTSAERSLIRQAGPADQEAVEAYRALISAGEDPLGDCFLAIRSPESRRDQGAVYTPAAIVRAMISWGAAQATPVRVVDPGAGSGRYIAAAAKAFPAADLVACEIDPLAALMLRANATVLGFSDRLDIRLTDYRLLKLPKVEGPTLYIGNPPYVRHHKISEEAKAWFGATASRLGFRASKLAGLHIHFFLRTREIAQPGDYGAFVTSSEWMDVNYGSVLREMLTDGLGGTSLQVFSPKGMPFTDAMTTGAITCFQIGNRPAEFIVREINSLEELDDLMIGRRVSWDEVKKQDRWSQIVKPLADRPEGFVELGELFRVHRGSVTGNNIVFIEGAYPGPLPERFLVPAITKGRELSAAGATIKTAKGLRRIIALPPVLSGLTKIEKDQVDRFLKWAKALEADKSFTARMRRAWWSVSLRDAAPIICTYMARKAPAFVRNAANAAHINIAHGLYPRVKMTKADLDAYAAYLSEAVCTSQGRTYAGGLTKFEPKEVERLLVPCLKKIHAIARTSKLDTSSAQRGRGRGTRNLPATAT